MMSDSSSPVASPPPSHRLAGSGQCFHIPLRFEDLAGQDAGQHKVNLLALQDTPSEELLAVAYSRDNQHEAFAAQYALVARYERLSAPQVLDLTAAVRDAAIAAVDGRASPDVDVEDGTDTDCWHEGWSDSENKEESKTINNVTPLAKRGKVQSRRPSDANCVKRSAFVLGSLATAAEADGSSGGEHPLERQKGWQKSGREIFLETSARLLIDSAADLWDSADREQLAGVILRPTLVILQHLCKSARDKPARASVARVMAQLFRLEPTQIAAASTSLLHISTSEAAVAGVAEVLASLAQEFGLESLIVRVIEEMVQTPVENLAPDDLKGYAKFFGDLADCAPEVVRRFMGTLLGLVDGEYPLSSTAFYGLRNGCIHAIGQVVLVTRDDPNERETRETSFGTLIERALADKNALTRSRALLTLSTLACNQAIPHRFYPPVAEAVATKLKDKAAAVRRSALKLLNGLIRNNPFGPSLKLVHFQKFATSETADYEDCAATSPSPTEDAAVNRLSASSGQLAMNCDASDDLKVQFYKSAMACTQALCDSVETVAMMQKSAGVSEISEIVQVHVAAAEFELEAVEVAMKSLLPLYARNEASVKEAVVCGFEMLMTPVDESPLHVAGVFVKLMEISSFGEIHLLNGIVLDLVRKNPTLFDKVFSILCRICEGKAASERERCAAWILIGFVSEIRPKGLQVRIEQVLLVLKPEKSGDILRWACGALCKLPAGSDVDGRICSELIRVIERTSCIPAVEQAVNAIYRIHPSPEADMCALLHRMEQRIRYEAAEETAKRVTGFLFVLGHVAIKQVVRFESVLKVFRNESESDKAMECAEFEIVSQQYILGKYASIARQVCADPNAPALVRTSAILCLSKFMSVQQKFCKQNIRSVLGLLTCNEPSVRANAIIALGNLACRFPNIVEPFVANLFHVLDDSDKAVRKTALMVLTHIALSGMIKFRSQMVDLLILTNDREAVIAGLARHFFQELQTKSPNMAFNFLPECIKLLTSRRELSPCDTKNLISFVVGFIDKQWHVESVVEKLCHRFGDAVDLNERRLSAFAISELGLTARAVQILAESFNMYASSLDDDEMFGYFTDAVTKARRTMVQVTGGASRKNNSRTGAEDTGKADELLDRLKRRKRSLTNGNGQASLN